MQEAATRPRTTSTPDLLAEPLRDQTPDQRALVLLQEVRAFSIVVGASRLIDAAKLSPTASGSTGSESPHSISVGRWSSRSASSTRCPGRGPRRVGCLRDQQREGPRAGLRVDARKRRVVGGDHLLARVVLAGAAHEEADRQILGPRDEVAERQPGVAHLLVPGEQAGVEDHDPLDPLRVLDREAQADRAAPVVHDDRRAAQVEILEQRRRQRDVAVVGVPVDVGRLVRATEAGEVRRQAAEAGVAHGRDHLAPQKRPGGLAVHEDHGRPLALVEVRQAQTVDLAVVGVEREVGEPLQQLLGCAHRVGHRRILFERPHVAIRVAHRLGSRWMHAAVLQLAPVLGAEKSKVPFYIAGGLLVAWALTLSLLIGMRRPDFPSSKSQQRGIIAVTAVLVLAAVSMAVVTSGGSTKTAATAATVTPSPAAESPPPQAGAHRRRAPRLGPPRPPPRLRLRPRHRPRPPGPPRRPPRPPPGRRRPRWRSPRTPKASSATTPSS